jgi:threonine dehydratase
MSSVVFTDLQEAARRIGPHLSRTPVLRSRMLDEMAGAQLSFKCENFQRAGVFKSRGAFNAVFSIPDSDATRGIVTSSSGNQAAAISLAAKVRGIPAYIAMPRIALASKVAAVRRYGGEIVWVESIASVPTSAEYEVTAEQVRQRTNAMPVHPYNDSRTIAGQGTAAMEFLDEVPGMEVLLAPVGGGGLLAGTSLAAKHLKRNIRVVGCEPEAADDAFRSFRAGRIIPQDAPRTIADGLRTSLGDLTFPIIQQHVDEIVTVSEQEIIAAMKLVWEVLKIVIEPSSAVPVAAAISGKMNLGGRSVGIILSGGNVDLGKLPWLAAGNP